MSCALRRGKSAVNVEERSTLQIATHWTFTETLMALLENMHKAVKQMTTRIKNILSVESEATRPVSTHSTGPPYTEMLLPDGKTLQMQFDSGATVNVMLAKHVGPACIVDARPIR